MEQQTAFDANNPARNLTRDALIGGLLTKLGQPPMAYPFERDPETWVQTVLAPYVTDPRTGNVVPFASFHRELWEWAWSIRLGEQIRPFVAIWPRGTGKSSGAEMVAVALGARRTRRYVLYVSATLERAEDHVQNVAAMLERKEVAEHYPDLATRMVTKYGHAKAWRRSRLRTSSGFTVDAIGLDTAARGIKLDDVRPDCMIFDDLDSEHDSMLVIEKKIKTLTNTFFPAGSQQVAILMLENIVNVDGIFGRLAGVSAHEADFLRNRIVSGPFPAAYDLVYEFDRERNRYMITGGTPTWEGMSLEVLEDKLNQMGPRAFSREVQQELLDPDSGLFGGIIFNHCDPEEVPELVQASVAVDPAVTDTDRSDCQAVNCDGLGVDKKIYRLFTWEKRSSPEEALVIAIETAIRYGSPDVVVETNQGGNLWRNVYHSVAEKLQDEGIVIAGVRHTLPKDTPIPKYEEVKVSGPAGSKAERASRMLVDYERNIVVHVRGTHIVLEKALRRFLQAKPYDAVDASYHSWNHLVHRKQVMSWA